MQAEDPFDKHSPDDESIDQYVRRRQIHLASTLEGKRAIFLDLKFWIGLRKVLTGEPCDPLAHELLDGLRNLVAEGKAYCPISESVFSELLKQGDLTTRHHTASLIDELSLGVALIPHNIRVGTELAHWIHSMSGRPTYPLQSLVWTRLSSVLGSFHPVLPSLDAAMNRQFQKAFFDHLWSYPLTEMLDHMSAPLPKGLHDFEEQAAKHNALKDAHAHELRSFQHTYKQELHGLLEVHGQHAAEIISDMARKETGSRPAPYSDDWNQCAKDCTGLLIAAFGKSDGTKTALPSIHIHTTLHAAIRWDKQQRFEPNHFLDFQHAAAAVGYCDAFFTEKTLSTVLTRKDVALDKRYGCQIVFSYADALSAVKTVSQR